MFNIINIIKYVLRDHFFAISLYSRQIAGTIVLLIIARYLSVYDYGLFTSYKNIATFCLMFANMEFANYILVSSKANVNEVKLKISLFMLNAINLLIFVSVLSLFFKIESHILFILIVVRTFFDNIFFALILPYFQASKKFNIIAIINMIYSFGVAIIAIISYFLKLSLFKFLILSIALGFINFIQCSYYIKINYLLVVNYIKRFVKMLDKSILSYIGSTITDYLYTQLSSLYVAIFLSKEEAALYFAAFTIAAVPNLLCTAQLQKILPSLLINDTKQKLHILNKNIKFILGILLLALIFIVIFGKVLLKIIYGNDYYQNAYIILILYFISNIFIANGAIHGVNITAQGYQSKKVQMKLETVFVTIISLVLLYKFNLYGAIITLLLSSIYVSIRYSRFSFNLINREENNNEYCQI